MKPRVLFVSRGRIAFPLSPGLEQRYAALSTQLDWQQYGTRTATPPTDPRFIVVDEPRIPALRGVWFHASLPFRVARELRHRRVDALVVQGAQETALTLLARRLARSDAAVVFDVQGDWRAATRLYGSSLRQLLAPLGDVLGKVAVRRSDAVRTITGYTSRLVREQGVEPSAEFPTLMDIAAFNAQPLKPLPERPTALFVGVLERYKAADVIAEASRRVLARLPDARVHIVGDGTLSDAIESLLAAFPERVRWTRHLSSDGVAAAMDESSFLMLPSRSEGMGRVVIESFCRGRPILGGRVGGIPDLVVDDVNGVLVTPGDEDALVSSMERMLADRALVDRLAAGARESASQWQATPDEWAERTRELVDTAIARRRGL